MPAEHSESINQLEDLVVFPDFFLDPDADEVTRLGFYNRIIVNLHARHRFGEIGGMPLVLEHISYLYASSGHFNGGNTGFGKEFDNDTDLFLCHESPPDGVITLIRNFTRIVNKSLMPMGATASVKAAPGRQREMIGLQPKNLFSRP